MKAKSAEEEDRRRRALRRRLGRRSPIPSPCEVYAAQGWDSVTLDMQHGASNINDAVPLLAGDPERRRCDAAGARAVERSRPDHARAGRRRHGHHLPDDQHQGRGRGAGARRAAIRRWASAASGPTAPRSTAPTTGRRPTRRCCCSPWSRRAQAVSNLEEILSVKGISGVYVGPSDLSLSMGKPPTLDPTDKEVLAAIDIIVKTTRKQGPDRRRAHRRAGDGAAALRGRLPDVHHPQRRAPDGGGRAAGRQRGARQGAGGEGEDVLRLSSRSFRGAN